MKSFRNINQIREYVIKSIMTLCACALIFYIANLGYMMKNASDNSQFARSISTITSSLAESEFQYIALKQSVTLEKAGEMGFVEVKKPQFIGLDRETAMSINRMR